MTPRPDTGRPRLPLPAGYRLAISGVTQQAVGDAAGVTRQQVNNYLAGRRRVTPRFREALERLCGEEDARAILAAIPRYVPRTRAATMREAEVSTRAA